MYQASFLPSEVEGSNDYLIEFHFITHNAKRRTSLERKLDVHILKVSPSNDFSLVIDPIRIK